MTRYEFNNHLHWPVRFALLLLSSGIGMVVAFIDQSSVSLEYLNYEDVMVFTSANPIAAAIFGNCLISYLVTYAIESQNGIRREFSYPDIALSPGAYELSGLAVWAESYGVCVVYGLAFGDKDMLIGISIAGFAHGIINAIHCRQDKVKINIE